VVAVTTPTARGGSVRRLSRQRSTVVAGVDPEGGRYPLHGRAGPALYQTYEPTLSSG
jgi:hypothetical protein